MSTYFLNSGGVVQSPFPKQTEQHAPGPYQFAEALVGRNVTFSLYQGRQEGLEVVPQSPSLYPVNMNTKR